MRPCGRRAEVEPEAVDLGWIEVDAALFEEGGEVFLTRLPERQAVYGEIILQAAVPLVVAAEGV
jgi:hypothetical protein